MLSNSTFRITCSQLTWIPREWYCKKPYPLETSSRSHALPGNLFMPSPGFNSIGSEEKPRAAQEFDTLPSKGFGVIIPSVSCHPKFLLDLSVVWLLELILSEYFVWCGAKSWERFFQTKKRVSNGVSLLGRCGRSSNCFLFYHFAKFFYQLILEEMMIKSCTQSQSVLFHYDIVSFI